MDSVWTEFSSDLQSHMGKGLPGPDTCHQKSCYPPQGCPPSQAPGREPSSTTSLRPLQTISSPLDFACFSLRVFHHSCFPGGCSHLLGGPRAFPPASVYSTLPQERSVPNTHLTTAPSSHKLLQRQKPDVARGPEVSSGHAEWPPCGLAPLVCAPDTGHPTPPTHRLSCPTAKAGPVQPSSSELRSLPSQPLPKPLTGEPAPQRPCWVSLCWCPE